MGCFRKVDWVLLLFSFGFGVTNGSSSIGHYFDTSYSHLSEITTPSISHCSRNVLNDICFETNMTYAVEKIGTENHLGTIGPPQSFDLCHITNISYTIAKGGDFVKLNPPNNISKFWTIATTNNFPGSSLHFNITCSITSLNNKVQFWKVGVITVEKLKCTPPRPQDPGKVFSLRTFKIKKGDTWDNLLFLDESSVGVHEYVSFIDNIEISGYLTPSCRYHVDSRNAGNRTIVHCKLIVTKAKFMKNDISFTLGLRNSNPTCAHKNNTGHMNITFEFGSKRIRRSNIFNNNSKIFRTAAPYARVTQPDMYTKNVLNYQCKPTNMAGNPFNITTEGIVYVEDFRILKKAPEFVNLNITWTKNHVIQWEEVRVRIVDEPVKTCANLKTEDEWMICSSYKSAKTCLRKDSCGFGTGGSTSVSTRAEPQRCMWRGDKNPENQETHLYSTCSSDTKYCPDGVCDSLEMLAGDLLCPQDCTTDIVFPTRLNEKTGRGVDKCNGILICDVGCSCLLRRSNINETKNAGSSQGDKLIGLNKNSDIVTCGTECILLAAGGIGSVVFILFFAVVLYRVIRTKKLTKEKYMGNLPEAETPFSDYIERNNVTNEPLVLNFHMTTSLDNTSSNTLKSYKVESKWKFPRQQIIIEQVLGEGEFGKVLKAKAFNIAGRPGYSLVAVKTLKDDARKQDYNDLFSEYQLLKEVNHPHVIQLLGVCSSEDGPLYIIIEYAAFGSLRNHLRKSRHIITTSELSHIEDNLSHKVTSRDILSFARQIASGMSYLSDIKLVHRDLAARNILLAENKVCKISDFGLTRDIYEDNAYFKKSKGRVPVKWMAPESLADHVYTTKSDVWSYGILIWELITLGASPYPGIPVHNLYNLLKQGYRMERPPNCSTVLYSLMNRCWNINPEERPSFLDLYHCFDNLLSDNVSYLDLSDNSIINKSYFMNFSAENDSSPSDMLDEKINFLRNNLPKNTLKTDDKLLSSVEVFRDNCIGYETPVKAPRPVITPTNEAPGEYTDMNAKKS